MSKTFICRGSPHSTPCPRACKLTVADTAHPWHCPFMGEGCDDNPDRWEEGEEVNDV